jgi:hypothetical protein
MKKITRQEALKAIILPALAAAFSGAAVTTAEAKSSKAAVKYQNKPKGTQACAGCRFFVPGKTSTAAGTCQIVSGQISPHGWCTAWTKK